ncbi:MAG: dTDP-glucose 4,6-dehydratase [Candidatus Pacearchaeota archaeon]
MNVLVTGGAGFIGSNFVRYLLRKYSDYKIVVLDKLTYSGRIENLHDIIDKIELIKGDIANKEDVKKVIKDVDLIINFAAETHVDRSIISSEEFIITNIYGTYNLLESIRKYDNKRLVHISTDEVYGQIINGSFKEGDKLNPRNPYSASKACADLLCLSFFETYGIDVVITRSTNNYGPYQHPEKLIPKSIIYFLQNKKIPIYGSGNAIRDWIYVEDNCEAIDIVLHHGKKGEIYNIASDEEKSVIDVVKTILKILNKGEDLIEYVKDRPGHDLRYSLDTNKIRKLGWFSKTRFEDGIKKTIKWYLANEWWWKPIIYNDLDFHKKF